MLHASQSGFNACGIYPLDKSKYLVGLFDCSEIRRYSDANPQVAFNAFKDQQATTSAEVQERFFHFRRLKWFYLTKLSKLQSL
jgi:hypothetical protein